MVTAALDPTVAEPEPEPAAVKYAIAAPPPPRTMAAVAAPAMIFFFRVNFFIVMMLLGMSEMKLRLGVGFATRSSQARRPRTACGSSRRHYFLHCVQELAEISPPLFVSVQAGRTSPPA